MQRLVFTAHPTVFATPCAQARLRAHLIQRLEGLNDETTAGDRQLRQQPFEEIRVWWRTDELHQFKPSVLDEVDYALHFFQQVLFQAMPLLHELIRKALKDSYPDDTAEDGFCTFGSWVGSDRDGNPWSHRRSPAHRLLSAPASAGAPSQPCAICVTN